MSGKMGSKNELIMELCFNSKRFTETKGEEGEKGRKFNGAKKKIERRRDVKKNKISDIQIGCHFFFFLFILF